MSKLIVDIVVGLPGSGRTTWMQTKNNPAHIFDNIGETDPDLQRFKKVISDHSVEKVSISETQFADVRVLFQTLTFLHEVIEEAGREDEYHFVLFPQSEAYCLRNVEGQHDNAMKVANIREFAPNITKTFIYLKNNFPRFTEEVRISPVMKNNEQPVVEEIPSQSSYLQQSADNFDVDMSAEAPITQPEVKKSGFSLGNFLRRPS